MPVSRFNNITSTLDNLAMNLLVCTVTFLVIASVAFIVGAPDWVGVIAAGILLVSLFGGIGALAVSTVLGIFSGRRTRIDK